METIYEEIPHVRAQLCEEADKLVVGICGPIGAEDVAEQSGAIATLVEIEQEDRARFREVYLRRVRPYLADPEAPHAELADRNRTAEIFDSLRRLLAAPVHGVLDDLENICEEEHQLSRQIRIYRWLHSVAPGACSSIHRTAGAGRRARGDGAEVLADGRTNAHDEKAGAAHRP